MNLFIHREGIGEKPLVFFHGWGFDHRIWLSLIPLLSAHYRVYLVDLPGFGLSDSMPWPVFKEKLLAYLPQEFGLLGWSMGGLYATRLAIECPTRVTHLINVAASPFFLRENNWPGIEQATMQSFLVNLKTDLQRTMQNFIKLQLKGSALPFILQQAPRREALLAGLQILNAWDLRKPLSNLTIPVCFILGYLDPIVPAKLIYNLKERYPQCHCQLFRKAAHMPFLSHSNDFIHCVESFL